jgi:phenylalanyl-tRNA synthetase alpha subunit
MVTFDEVLKHFGGTHETLGAALGISREAVSMWKGEIPEGRAFQIEVLSGGHFKAADLPLKRKAA